MGDRIFSGDGVIELREIVYMDEEAILILLQGMSGYTHWSTERIRMHVDKFMWEAVV
jgi:hypothetical protein